jgi:hypothetical protein
MLNMCQRRRQPAEGVAAGCVWEYALLESRTSGASLQVRDVRAGRPFVWDMLQRQARLNVWPTRSHPFS